MILLDAASLRRSHPEPAIEVREKREVKSRLRRPESSERSPSACPGECFNPKEFRIREGRFDQGNVAPLAS